MKTTSLARLRANLRAVNAQWIKNSARNGCAQAKSRAKAGVLAGAAALWLLGGVAGAANSKIGGNFWFRGDWAEKGNNNVGQHQVFRTNANFSTDSNPFDQTFLDEITPYSALRCMDWNPTNNSTEQNWSDRRQKTDPNQVANPGEVSNYNAVVGGTGGTPTKGVAYEWQVQLCNLKGCNYWVNIPHRATDDYIKNLADLVRDNLNSGRTIYVEYSNEVWNSQFAQNAYATAQGNALGIPAKITGVDPGIDNNTKANQGFYVSRSLQAFKIFKQEFGSGSGRVKGVLAGLVHDGWQMQVWQATINSSSLNPSGIKPDYVASSAYPGMSVDGAASDALQQLYASETDTLTNYVKRAKANATNLFGVPLALYEAGMGTTTNSATLAANQGLYDWQKQFMTDLTGQADLVMLYCHVSNYGNNGSYGLKNYIGQDPAQAPRYRALLDWTGTSPNPTPTLTPTPAPTTDNVASLSGPSSVSPGQTVGVSVSYSASTNRNIWVMLLKKDSTWTFQGGASTSVSAGSGTVTVNVPVSASAPLGTNYCWQAQVQTTSGTNVANTAQQDNVAVVAQAASTDAITFYTAPAFVVPGQSVNVSVSYSATTNRQVRAMLQNPSNWNYYGGAQVNVSGGTGTTTLSVPVYSNIPLAGSTYCWQVQVLDTNGNVVGTTAQQIYVSAVSALPSSGDSISFFSALQSVKQGQTVPVTVSYRSSTSRQIRAMIQNPSNWNYYGGATVNVVAGTGTVTVNVPVYSSIPVANATYCWQVQVLDGSSNVVGSSSRQNNISATASTGTASVKAASVPGATSPSAPNS